MPTDGTGETDWLRRPRPIRWTRRSRYLPALAIVLFVTPNGDLATDRVATASGSNVPLFLSATDSFRAGVVRLINYSEVSGEVSIYGIDDSGDRYGPAQLTVGAKQTVHFNSNDLESGNADKGIMHGIGRGQGHWRLELATALDIDLANRSGARSFDATRCRARSLVSADSSIVEYLNEPLVEGKSPGLFAAIVDENGIRAVAAVGSRREGSPVPVTTGDLLHIGSNTKAMTAAMLATLVADRTFAKGWQTTVADVFPELLDEIQDDYHRVTLRQLVSMTGGIARDALNWWAYAHLPIVARRQQILKDNLALDGSPMDEYLYSNLSYMVAGAMAEKVTGATWETLMKERLFRPLGMSSVGFGAPGSHGEIDQPWGHARDSEGRWQPSQRDNPPALGPAGTVHLSLEDWAKFLTLWLPSKEPAILDRSTLDELTVPVAADYAAGWGVVTRSWAGGVALNHWGSNLYWHTVVWVAPSLNRVFIAAANARDDDTFETLDDIIGHLIGHSPRQVAHLD